MRENSDYSRKIGDKDTMTYHSLEQCFFNAMTSFTQMCFQRFDCICYQIKDCYQNPFPEILNTLISLIIYFLASRIVDLVAKMCTSLLDGMGTWIKKGEFGIGVKKKCFHKKDAMKEACL